MWTLSSILAIVVMIAAQVLAEPAMLRARGRNKEKNLLKQISIISLAANTMILFEITFNKINPAYGIFCSILTISLTYTYAKEYNRIKNTKNKCFL